MVRHTVYEAIEWSLAVALPVVTILIGTPLQAIARRRLVRNEAGDEIWLLFAITCGLCAAIGIASVLCSPDSFAMSAAIGGTVAMQIILAEWWRSGPSSPVTAWLDGFPLLLCVMVVGCITLTGWIPTEKAIAALLIAVMVISTFIASIKLNKTLRRALFAQLRESFNSGKPIAAAALFGVWLGVSGCVLIGLVDAADMATYAVAFRLAGAALIVHQVGLALFYRRIYTARTRHADRLLSLLLSVGWLIVALAARRFGSGP